MPKRKNKDSDSAEYILRKIRKLEKKMKKRSRKKSPISSDESNTGLSLQEDNQLEQSVSLSIIGENTNDEINSVEFNPTAIQDSTLQFVETEQQNAVTINPDLPSTSEAPSEPAITLDENILDLLGEPPSKNKNYSSPIQAELAVRWEHIATTGLSKDIKKTLFEEYFIPENCLKIGAPKLNPEIKAALSDALVKKDRAIENKQNQQAIAISCIGQALTRIFVSQNKDVHIIKSLIDAVRLLCDSQYIESMSRRSFVTSTIKKDIKDQLYTTEIDTCLFGEKLADTLKAAKVISKSGAEMKTPSQSKPVASSQLKFTQSLNTRPPLHLARQVGAGRRSAPAMQQPRRYQAPHPPPNAVMRYHPPPPHAPSAPQPRSRGRTQQRR